MNPLATFGWVEHRNDSGVGEGHASFRPCTEHCSTFDTHRFYGSMPPLSWEDGYPMQPMGAEELDNELDFQSRKLLGYGVSELRERLADGRLENDDSDWRITYLAHLVQ